MNTIRDTSIFLFFHLSAHCGCGEFHKSGLRIRISICHKVCDLRVHKDSGCIFFTTSTKMPQGPKIFCLALIVDMLYFFSPQPHILGISSNLYTYVKLYTFSSHLLKLTKSVQWLTHVAEITLVDKKSKKNCLTAKFWQKMPQCSLANVWRIYTPGILRVGSGWIGTVSVFEISCTIYK